MRKRMSKEKMELIMLVILMVFFIGKGIINLIATETGNSTNYTATEALAILEEADTVDICKNYRTLFKKDYSIIVDGDRVATVEGEYFKLLGDKFTMYSSNGEVMAYEKEEKLHLTRQAQFYDAAGNKTGRLHSKFFALFRKDTFYNAGGEAIARCDEKFTFIFPDKFTIHDMNGNEFYTIEKKWWFDNYVLDLKDESILDIRDAIMINCIEDAVSGSSSNSSSSSSKSSKK